ncbi:MAG: RsmB/NOP family class I SAM-dependent RNA methyltransferase [Victivallaceae bacterium]
MNISNFLRNHLEHVLQLIETVPTAPDRILARYFKDNHCLGSKDRKVIANLVFSILRRKGTLAYITGKNSLKEYINLLLQPDFSFEEFDLPIHLKYGLTSELWELLNQYYGENFTRNFGIVCDTPAPATIRINPLKTTREELMALWKDKYFGTFCKESDLGISFHKRYPLESTPEFKKGWFEFQDESSQCAARWMQLFKHDTVLDYCAGTGGKSLACADRAGRLFLHDIRTHCLNKAVQRLQRAGVVNTEIIYPQFMQGIYSVVLTDVPCTGTGTYRRSPWLKWEFSSDRLNKLLLLQREIVKKAVSFLAPSGRLVYMTCSILPQENEEQIEFFQKEYGLTLTQPLYRHFPAKGTGDGFFMADLSL